MNTEGRNRRAERRGHQSDSRPPTEKPRLRACCAIPVLLVLLAGCAVGPDYQRPAVDTPATYRHSTSTNRIPSGTKAFGVLAWWDASQDPRLKAYIAEALDNSWDIQMAAARVLQAEAAARVTRSQFFQFRKATSELKETLQVDSEISEAKKAFSEFHTEVNKAVQGEPAPPETPAADAVPQSPETPPPPAVAPETAEPSAAEKLEELKKSFEAWNAEKSPAPKPPDSPAPDPPPTDKPKSA